MYLPPKYDTKLAINATPTIIDNGMTIISVNWFPPELPHGSHVLVVPAKYQPNRENTWKYINVSKKHIRDYDVQTEREHKHPQE